MLHIRDLRVVYEGNPVLNDLHMHVGDGETVAVLGPSGSGKSTLLRVVAGLERPAGGRVLWDGDDLGRTPPHRRNFGLMFQDFALFPHRDVAGNVAFGLRMKGWGRDRIAEQVAKVLAWVGLEGFEGRSVHTLSGGEQQRVALARALAPEPGLLMLDEPLGSLDRTLRQRLLAELREILDRPDVTALYVTHDQEEAFAVADRVALLYDGRIQQSGPPEEVWTRPSNEWVARFLGMTAILPVRRSGGRAESPWGSIPLEGPDGPARIVLRPEAVVLEPRAEGQRDLPANGFEGVVVANRFRGGYRDVEVALADGPRVRAEEPITAANKAPRFGPGEPVTAVVNPQLISVLEAGG